MSWCTYPFGYTSENVGLAGNKATLYEQIGFSLADVVAKETYELPEVNIITVGSERFRYPEVLFIPSFIGNEASGIPDAFQSIMWTPGGLKLVPPYPWKGDSWRVDVLTLRHI